MTATPQPESRSTSRRALLVGAIGGIGALAASAIGRPSVAEAHDVDDVRLGGSNSATTTTSITNSVDSSTTFAAYNSTGYAIYASTGNTSAIFGDSNSGIGVRGTSDSYYGVSGSSNSGVGIEGVSLAIDRPAIRGWSYVANFTGVQGYSGNATPPAAKPKTGVHGYAAQDSLSRGVFGESPAGHGIHGQSISGWAGFFAGKVYTARFHEMKEISAPAAPPANRARLFLRDNGSGKTQLCVRFNTGGVLVIKTQP